MNPHPVPPVPPIYKSTSHLVHMILTIVTGGLWGMCVWFPLAMTVNMSNNAKRNKYQQEMTRYQHEVRMLEAHRGQ